MAISKGRIPQELLAGFVQPCYLYGNDISDGASLQVLDPSASLEFFCHKSSKGMLEDSGSLEPLVDYTTVSSQPSLSEPSNSSSSSSFVFGTINSRPKEPQSVLTFKSASDYSFCNVSMLSFEQETQANSLVKLSYGDDSAASWGEALFPSHQVLHHLNPRSGSTDHRLAQEANCFKGTHGYEAGVKEHQREEEFGWLYSEEKHDNILQENRGPDGGAHKRPCMGDDAPSSKRQCTASNRKSKPKVVTSKDNQSIAAKNRRERISERLKVLQALVPNGTKVDLVTMLEKAISYVKFLQLQVKVLSTDEFWPAQGGKAPEVAQVKEAIDTILSSHKERNFVAK
ncbi:hypothetical protein Taro_009473 [Colocasia esculenta]|uniref:BHLH domain-containing protein n=1 Tax=Colocasia esculenta TaxID=4460 RepID=A0A843U442_COLES|nr:hypothetical protein [Colocasia esculenta]